MNTLTLSTLRPGLLVSLKTTISGGVSYQTQDIEADHYTATGERQARWETLRTVENPAEHEQAIKVRSKARAFVTSVCSQSAFGLLCPESRTDDLAKAISDARALADEFNRTASHSTVKVFVVAGRIAANDLEAARAIRSEVTDLLTDMEQGINKLDVKVVREAANKARNLGQMLTPDAASRLQEAIAAARTIARRIVQAGDTAAAAIDQTVLATLSSARTAFLDLDAPQDTALDVMSVNEITPDARAIDFDPEPATLIDAGVWAAPKQQQLEFDTLEQQEG